MNKVARSNRRKDVPSVQLAHERIWQLRGGSNVLSLNRRLLERLEAENAQLRGRVVENAVEHADADLSAGLRRW
jgi:hypothetical protein